MRLVEVTQGHRTAATLEHPRPYLYRITANLAVDFMRKAKVRLRYLSEETEFFRKTEGPAGPGAEGGAALDLRRLKTTLAELPQVCGEAFLLNRVEGLSRAEIAQRFGLSVRTIDRHIAKVQARLREALGPRQEDFNEVRPGINNAAGRNKRSLPQSFTLCGCMRPVLQKVSWRSGRAIRMVSLKPRLRAPPSTARALFPCAALC
jgi:RNA polymerase sigma factor (sigma-70 family)